MLFWFSPVFLTMQLTFFGLADSGGLINRCISFP